MNDYLAQFKAARRVGVPLLAINTPDPAATIATLAVASNGKSKEGTPTVKVEWDIVGGFRGRGEAGDAWIASLPDPGAAQNPVDMLDTLRKHLPGGGVAFVHMAHRYMESVSVIQAIWNLRDEFKTNHRMCVLLTKGLQSPIELVDDLIILDEELPTREQLAEIVSDIYRAAGMEPDCDTIDRATEALRGLSAFAAEQVTAMSITRDGLDIDALWQRKKQQIEQCPGLKVLDEEVDFGSIGGCEVIKDFAARLMHGNGRPNAVVFVDEIEKMLAGRGDTSGVSQDQLGVLLTYMQDQKATGMIFIGPPGAAKSAVAKAIGREGGIPTIQLDLGAAKGSLVGQSEHQIRQALKVITSVSNGRSLWIATCNSIAELPPELRRRFTLGTFFFDLPTREERDAIWAIYTQQYQCIVDDAAEALDDEGWTGAEIKQCCEIAWRLGCSIAEAAQFVVPVSRSAASAINALREQASGRFLSASRPGVYESGETRKAQKDSAMVGRKIELEN